MTSVLEKNVKINTELENTIIPNALRYQSINTYKTGDECELECELYGY